ncbi:MAG: PIN domain-containing protein [Dehalococcoidia bacterium]|nr:PIN domain-containing protein [Dehalococcoidia bacterium]
MTDAVFDTTVFIDAYRGRAGAIARLDAAVNGRLLAAYSPVTAYEIWLRRMSRAEELVHASMLLALEEVPFTAVLARQVAAWLRALSRSQRLRLAADAMIAATATSLGATVYTRNPRDFQRFYPNVEAY